MRNLSRAVPVVQHPPIPSRIGGLPTEIVTEKEDPRRLTPAGAKDWRSPMETLLITSCGRVTIVAWAPTLRRLCAGAAGVASNACGGTGPAGSL